jgi:hypothetical protein
MGHRLVRHCTTPSLGRASPPPAFTGTTPRAAPRRLGQAAAWLLHPEALIGRTQEASPTGTKEFPAP